MKILIAMLFECAFNEESKEAVNEINIYKQTPNKVYMVTLNDKRTIAEAKRIAEKFPNIEFQTVFVPEFDVVAITKEVNKIVRKEKGNKIYINVTEGRKTMFLAGVFSASLNKELVEGAFYLRQDTHELMPIPLMDFNISENKMKILKELENGNKKVTEINKIVKVNRSLVYASIKDMIKRRYLTKEWEVTDSGKICLMTDSKA